MAIEVSYCVVNTEQRELLLRGLDAIARERADLPFESEVLVLDNASRDGSAHAAESHSTVTAVVRLDQRTGKGENDSALLQRALDKDGLPALETDQAGRFYEYPGDPLASGVGTPVSHTKPA